MGDLGNIVLALAGLLAGLEIALFVFKEPLLRAPQARDLERQIESAKVEAVRARDLTQIRQAESNAARTRNEAALAALRQASRDLAAAQTPREMLVHRAGEAGPLPLFRAPLRKTLPPTPEENQALLWSYDNAVDVWAANPAAAQKIAARVFAAKAGYEFGEFKRVDAGAAEAAPQDAAA